MKDGAHVPCGVAEVGHFPIDDPEIGNGRAGGKNQDVIPFHVAMDQAVEAPLRANSVKQYLISLGIPAGNLNTVSFGKEKPFCMEADEACYTKNRRGHFVQAK